MKTATEILGREISIPCYLCGKGKIRMRTGDIMSIEFGARYPLDREVQRLLKIFLTKQAEKFLKNLTKKP